MLMVNGHHEDGHGDNKDDHDVDGQAAGSRRRLSSWVFSWSN